MKVTVFGAGYVGLVQSAVLAEIGCQVVCVENNLNKVLKLQKGIIHLYEPGLVQLIQKNLRKNKLTFTTNLKFGIKHGLIQCIAVGTPLKNNRIDISAVYNVVVKIAKNMENHKIILKKSTVPIGTSEKIFSLVKKILKNRNKNLTFDIVFNPEFLKEGTAISDCMHPERIIFGINNINSINILKKLYKPFCHKKNSMIFMDFRSAELTKYAANCMLATKISFMNEMANLAEIFGADIEKIRQGIGSDSRIGKSYIYPGCGYGGSCFPKDVRGLILKSKEFGYEPKLLHAVEEINIMQKNKLFKLIQFHFRNDLYKKTFALWGLSFKPNTNDIREASSCMLMESLWNCGAKVQAFDPKAMQEISLVYKNNNNLKLMHNKESTLEHADALIICTEWKQFYFPDFKIIKSKLKHPVIFDGRNLYNPKYLKNNGFLYYGIGRGESCSRLKVKS
ncbi:UDP-glucose dehydrogenase [Wigglesworthia glossinidia endosymbiont of Glossina morsitans morsitans (Yale colony)]|uniref:UDP-glucose 6-dehydrogenase n=1 Tax=Wigglesworthia glossinidia endosymbiont of Glossina morsitans morsitans (Yale colony) TaxID=1142511 RepID=H6Q4U7_WIGGL|nr:UDP-glucose/GDP-mannose dehydrogenase family protein [Wigglesworthia glossinidia]AFA41230.1 UDP-glucose dehydrogenase [Wigglesworthia glossinidia endosymbiont of Glossina morsitans morsitans (Yale colony)]